MGDDLPGRLVVIVAAKGSRQARGWHAPSDESSETFQTLKRGSDKICPLTPFPVSAPARAMAQGPIVEVRARRVAAAGLRDRMLAFALLSTIKVRAR